MSSCCGSCALRAYPLSLNLTNHHLSHLPDNVKLYDLQGLIHLNSHLHPHCKNQRAGSSVLLCSLVERIVQLSTTENRWCKGHPRDGAERKNWTALVDAC